MILSWGRDELTFFFNETYFPLLGPRLDWAMGAPFTQVWADAWEQAKPIIDDAFAGRSQRFIDLPWKLDTDRGQAETWWTFSYSRILDVDGEVAGLLIVTTETTENVLTERRRTVALQALAQREAFQAALLKLDDELRELRDPGTIAEAATAMLGRTLGASIVGYGLVDAETETIEVEHDWTDGAASFAGSVRLRDYGTYVEDLKRGEAVVVGDVHEDPRLHGKGLAAELLERGVGAFVNVPIFEQGCLRALLYLGKAEPFDWPDDALALAREVASRVRVATERARSERELRESEEQFRVFAQTVPNQVWAAGPDGVLYWVNDQAVAYLGPSAETLYGAGGWTRYIHPDDLPPARAAWENAVRTGRRYEIEFRIRDQQGQFRWFVARAEAVRGAGGKVVNWVGTNTDIDDAKRQANELAEMNASLEEQVAQRTADRNRLWQMSTDIMLVADFDGTIEAVNPAWTAVLGWSEDELLGRPLFDLIHPDDMTKTVAGATAIAGGESLSRFENRYRRKDGTYRDMAWTAGPGDGKIVGVGRDETEEKTRAAQLAAAEEQLRQSQKMEAVGQLTGGIAHDFNNMLTGVIGSMDLLKRLLGDSPDPKVSRYVDAAATSAQRAAGLTQRLLAFSRRQSLDIRPVDANALVAGLEDLFRRTLGENIALEIALHADAWAAGTDENQLESALLNLAINARDAMPGGGRLRIETANVRLDARDTDGVEGLEPGDYVSVSVSDTGTGMTPAVAAKAFDPFFTTKPIGAGTGLGLSMIWGFAKQSGGHVRIDTAPGSGTTIELLLPRHVGEAAAEATAAPASRPAADGERVLVVEDDPAVRMLVTDVLADLGYVVEQAADAREAIPLLDRTRHIDLLVTDVGLPGLNGRQLAEIARSKRPDLKILFVTGYAEGAEVRGGFLGEGMDMISKPFAIDMLSAKIREMLGHASD